MDKTTRHMMSSAPDTDAQKILALDALTRVTSRFARTPDIDRLAEETLLVAAGQLGVGSAFLVLLREPTDGKPACVHGIGLFHDERAFAPLLQDPEWEQTIRRLETTWVTDRGHAHDSVARWTMPVQDAGIHVISPFRCSDACVGYLALGKRVTGKRYSNQEIEFLETMTNTVAPLLSNALLLDRISRLNERHKTILDSVGQGVLVFDRAYRLIHVNAAGVRILSHIAAEISVVSTYVGRDLDDVFPDSVYPSWANRIRTEYSGDASRRFENLIAHGPEGDRVFNVQIGDVKHEGALPEAEVVVTLDDITVQHDSEERLFELQRFAERGMMAASIAHELNNFLGMMMGSIELARVAVRSGDTDKIVARLTRLQESVTKMERFTGGLMDLGRLKTEKAPIDLNATIRSVVSFATVQKRFKPVRTAMDLDPRVPPLEMDEDQITQVLINLLNNAADAVRESSMAGGEIRLMTQMHDDHVRLIVADNGPGMAANVRDSLFQRQITTKKTGHGYGLATCHRIISDHGGTIAVESEPGRGTSFTITFPIA